jgi:hypothetical protein
MVPKRVILRIIQLMHSTEQVIFRSLVAISEGVNIPDEYLQHLSPMG